MVLAVLDWTRIVYALSNKNENALKAKKMWKIQYRYSL